MAETADKPKRKSVAFSEGTTVFDTEGQVTEMNGGGEKSTAESHSAEGDAAVDEVTVGLHISALNLAQLSNSVPQDMLKDLAKKKKKKTKKDGEEGADADKPAADGDEIDMSALKKKKKKKTAKPVDDFDKQLAEADGGDAPEEEESVEVEGDIIKGTGIWAHDSTAAVPYRAMLSRFFTMLSDRHPDLVGGSGKSFRIPPPQCLREGNKKTLLANLHEICKRLKRPDEHVTSFLFAELGTSGSVDGSKRLVIRGRFQAKQIEKYVLPISFDCLFNRTY
jgi:translation initiation factor 2 subunit 2